MSDSNEQELAEITPENNSEQAVELREGGRVIQPISTCSVRFLRVGWAGRLG